MRTGPAPTLTSGGRWVRHLGAGPVAKRQPGSSCAWLGGMPGISFVPVALSLRKSGTEARRPRVYGCTGCNRHVDGAALLGHLACVKHSHAVGVDPHCANVMGDQNHCDAVFLLDLADLRARNYACTVASNAVVGSSAISTRGRAASARAIIARCSIPPDSSCG